MGYFSKKSVHTYQPHFQVGKINKIQQTPHFHDVMFESGLLVNFQKDVEPLVYVNKLLKKASKNYHALERACDYMNKMKRCILMFS